MVIRILSWNVQWGRGADGRVDWGRIAAVIERVAPDVVCLQEVAQNMPELPGNDSTDQVEWLRRRFPDWEGFFAPGFDRRRADGSRGRFGNWLGSRWPVLAFRALSLPTPTTDSPRWLPRSVCDALVTIEGRPLRVLATHLEYYSTRQRLAQAMALVALGEEGVVAHGRRWERAEGSAEAEERGNSAELDGEEEEAFLYTPLPMPAEAVLVGDLNFAPDDSDYRLLSEGGVWVDAWRLVHGEKPHAPTVGLHGAPWPDTPYCCDYAWVSPALAPRVLGYEVLAETPASDHQPVVVTISW
ncbi:MAG: endonuclease/exonuclease/phosphatase family protein [Hydrogenophilus sp.]|nr:endonuclease/exonuclease/phosphatase family protein [Hydrogenophilus sp.]